MQISASRTNQKVFRLWNSYQTAVKSRPLAPDSCFERCQNKVSLEFHRSDQAHQCSRIKSNFFGSSIFHKGTKFKVGSFPSRKYLCHHIPPEKSGIHNLRMLRIPKVILTFLLSKCMLITGE